MKKIISISILLITIVFQSSGQKTKDVIYLKNGSMIYGTLMEISNNQYKLKGTDGSIFIYSTDEVDRYAKEVPEFAGRKKTGITFSLEAGLLIGAQSNEYPAPFSFNGVAGYAIAKNNTIALGSGAEFLGKTFVPLFFEYRYTVRDKRVSPFLFMRGGVIIHAGSDEDPDNNNYYYIKDYEGGPSLTFGTGLSWSRDDIETYLSFAYRYAQTSYVQKEYNEQTVTYENNYNRLEVKFGFRF